MVAIEIFKAVGDKCLKSFTNIFNDVFFKDKLPEGWMLSSLVPIFKGKGKGDQHFLTNNINFNVKPSKVVMTLT